MSGKPIDEAVLDRACEAYAEIAGDYMGFVRRRAMSAALTAAQQQGQAPPPSAPVVDEAMTRRIMADFHANDPGDVWPPDEQGRLRRQALQDAINKHLAAAAPAIAQKPAAEEQLTYKGVPIGPMQTFADMERQASAPVGVDWITGDGLQGIKAEAHFLTQHKEEAVQRAGKRLLGRADKIIAALSQQPAPSAPARPKVGLVRAGDGTYYAFEKGQSEQPAAVDRARFRKAPCYLCGYNGPGYFQPETHPCAALYHATQHQEPKS